MSVASQWWAQHRAGLERAVTACAERSAWSPFIESPKGALHPEGAKAAGRAWFEACLHTSFPLQMPGEVGRTGAEVSPYTAQPLGIDYPQVDVERLVEAAQLAGGSWARGDTHERMGVCMEVLHRLAADVFGNAFATMHTAGQGFMMAFAGSGANSLDRGLEALAYAYKAIGDVPREASFERAFAGRTVRLVKRYRLVPMGVAAIVACGSYPAWNVYPALMANLATGNAAVVKPHPGCILPVARMVQIAREVLTEAGFDPNVVTLAADTEDAPLTKALLERVSIIDFTGSQRFGAWIEEHCTHADTYTETSGCNAVVVESATQLQPVLDALAQSLCLFSAQMCTAAQNIFVPADGVRVGDRRVSPDAFATALAETVDALLADSARAAAICGAVQSGLLRRTLEELGAQDRVVRAPGTYVHPDFPDAATATPVILRRRAPDSLYQREQFGPVGFVIDAGTREDALAHATGDAKAFGAIACYAYTVDPAFAADVEDAFAQAGASVGINLLGHRPINYTAAFSDYHVTGLNPAGNACLTDLSFVTRRFRIVQSKTELA